MKNLHDIKNCLTKISPRKKKIIIASSLSASALVLAGAGVAVALATSPVTLPGLTPVAASRVAAQPKAKATTTTTKQDTKTSAKTATKATATTKQASAKPAAKATTTTKQNNNSQNSNATSNQGQAAQQAPAQQVSAKAPAPAAVSAPAPAPAPAAKPAAPRGHWVTKLKRAAYIETLYKNERVKVVDKPARVVNTPARGFVKFYDGHIMYPKSAEEVDEYQIQHNVRYMVYADGWKQDSKIIPEVSHYEMKPTFAGYKYHPAEYEKVWVND